MANVENPYSKLLDDVTEASQLHRIESNRIKRNMLETKLEESVKKYANNPLIESIKAQKHISEDDQGFIDMNIFSVTFYKNKLDLSKDFEKEYKKFNDLAAEYKTLVQQRITKYNLSASMLSKFTPEEIKKNPKLSKISNEVPAGYEEAYKKYVRQDVLLSNIFAKYISQNSEEYTEKLYKFLNESKQFRLDFIKMKQLEVDSLKEKEVETTAAPEEVKKKYVGKLFGNQQADFDVLSGLIKEEDKCSQEQLNELKSFISKLLSSEELGQYTKLEEELSKEYQKLDSAEGIIAKRLQLSLDQFQKGVDKIEDMIVETGTSENLYISLNELLNKELYERDLNELKHDVGAINMLVGYSARITTYLNENNATRKRGLFGGSRSKTSPTIASIDNSHKEFVNYIIEKVKMDPNLFSIDILGTMITDDKKDEISYALMNNASSISNTGDIGDWQDAISRLLGKCILEMIDAIEEGVDPMDIIAKYREQYGAKEKDVKAEIYSEEVRRNRSIMSKEEQTNAIKNILR